MKAKLKMKFSTEVGFYKERHKWGYLIYEVGSGAKLLCIVSPALWSEPEIAGMNGVKEAEQLLLICQRHFLPKTQRDKFHARAL